MNPLAIADPPTLLRRGHRLLARVLRWAVGGMSRSEAERHVQRVLDDEATAWATT